MFRIGEFSKLCHVPTSALRYYADIGLLEPAHIDQFTGYRYYSLSQLPRLNRILALKDLGLSLDEIKRLLNDDVEPAEIRGILRFKETQIQQQIEEEQARLERVKARLRQIEREGLTSTQDIVIKTIESQRAYAIRELLPTPSHVGVLLGEAIGAMMAHNIQPGGVPVAIFHDQEFKPQDMDAEIAVPVMGSVPDEIALDGGRQLQLIDLPGMAQAACGVHAGSFATIHDSYMAVARWIETSGYKMAGASREVYLTLPDANPPITEIQFPVER